jgi:thioredoxin reductase (NADPH)
MLGQARAFGLEIKTAEAAGITLKKGENPCFEVGLSGGDSMEALSIVIATGARWNTLGVPGEKELTGRGVSYCATCDGPLFRKKDVIVVGGGDTALEDALFLARFANKVTVVHRRDRLRAARILQERAGSNSSIEFCLSSAAERIIGRNKVEGLEVRNVDTNEKKTLKADGVFILIGVTPNSEIVKDLVKLCPKGYVITDDDMRSSAEGIFACGDARMKLLRQIVTAAGEGATAATSAQHYVERLKGIEYK